MHEPSFLIRGLSQTYGMGDIVWTLPMVGHLRTHFPHSRIDIIGLAQWERFYHGLVNNYYSVPKQNGYRMKMQLSLSLRKHHYTYGVLLQRAFEAALFMRIAGAKTVVGYDSDLRGILLHQPLDESGLLEHNTTIHRVEYYYRIAQHITGSADAPSFPVIVPTPEEERSTAATLAAEGIGPDCELILINPAAAMFPAKLWHPQGWAQVISALLKQGPKNRTVLLISQKELAHYSIDVHALIPDPRVKLFINKFNYGELFSLFRRLTLIISTDGGLAHVASLFDLPCIALFGPTNDIYSHPYHAAARVVKRSLDCMPCLRPICPLKHHACMEELPPEMILAAAREFITV